MSSLGNLQNPADTQAGRLSHGEPEPERTTRDRDDRIREVAYFLWLDEGCPEGRADRHWATAAAASRPSLNNGSVSKASLLASR